MLFEELSPELCIEDSPRYRSLLRIKEEHVSSIEAKFRKVTKACDEMLSKNDKFSQSISGFLDCVGTLAGDAAYANKDVASTVGKFAGTLKELEAQRSMMMRQTKTTVSDSLLTFLEVDLKETLEAGFVVNMYIYTFNTPILITIYEICKERAKLTTNF